MTSSAPSGRPPSARLRVPRALNVVRDPSPEDLGSRIDWSSWYLTDQEDMGESNEQSLIIALLRSSLGVLVRQRGWEHVYVGSDQFFAWIEAEPLVRVSPDIYLLDNPPPAPLPDSWQTWLGHAPPRFAVEVVSGRDSHPKSWRKDYEDSPQKYAQLGTQELVIFDPQRVTGQATRHGRVPLQLYRREADGAFVRTYAGDGPVESDVLGAWLLVTRDGRAARLRIARDPLGHELVPTEAEETASERARADDEHLRAERAERELDALRLALGRRS